MTREVKCYSIDSTDKPTKAYLSADPDSPEESACEVICIASSDEKIYAVGKWYTVTIEEKTP